MVLDLKNASFYFKALYEIIAFYVLSYNHKLWVKCFIGLLVEGFAGVWKKLMYQLKLIEKNIKCLTRSILRLQKIHHCCRRYDN